MSTVHVNNNDESKNCSHASLFNNKMLLCIIIQLMQYLQSTT